MKDIRNRGRIYNELLKIRHSLGKKYKISATHSDLETELNLSHDLFVKIFHCSPLPMIITSSNELRFIDVNKAFLEIIGYSRDEIINRTLEDLETIGSPELERLRLLVEKGANRDLEFDINTCANVSKPVVISTEYIEYNNKKCLLLILRDLSELRSLQKEMARLGQLNLVGEMAASIGHEIRNPMTTARGFLQMLGSKDECLKYKEYFDLIIEELDRANTIVSEFLSMAQIQQHSYSEQNLNTIINTLLPLIQADSIIRDISVSTELEQIPDIPLVEKEIRQLILNLARNALEAMSSGGSITIKTGLENESIVLSISDQGTGIKPELIKKLGTPFLTTKENGTGLGLAVCFGIASRHQASITFDTSPKGTTFYVRFKIPQS